jgi:hypothetical protein
LTGVGVSARAMISGLTAGVGLSVAVWAEQIDTENIATRAEKKNLKEFLCT